MATKLFSLTASIGTVIYSSVKNAFRCVQLAFFLCFVFGVGSARVSIAQEFAPASDAQAAAASQAIEAYNQQLRGLIGEISNATSQASPPAASLLRLMTDRQKLVESLIPQGWDSVNAIRLTPDERQRLVAKLPQANSLIEENMELTGQAQQLVRDNFAGHQSQSQWRIATTKDRYWIYFGKQPVPGQIHQGLPLKVTGIRSGRSIAVKTTSTAKPTDMAGPASAAVSPKTQAQLTSGASGNPPVCSTTGTQNIAVLMMTTPSNPTFPSGWDETFLENHFFGNSGLGLNTYWQQASYGQTSSSGNVYGPFVLSRDYTCGVDDEQMMTDSVAAASSSVDFTQYDRVALVFPVQTCTYGGLGSIGCDTGLVTNQAVSEAWFPIFPSQETSQFISLTAHELGHNLGLNHGNSDDYGSIPLGPLDESGVNTEYGDPYTVMGDDYNVSGEYVGQHKSTLLGWVPFGGYEEINSSGNYSLSPLENPGGVKSLRIIRNVNTGAALWLEYRQPLGIVDSTFENLGSQSNVYAGASIRYQDPNLDTLHTYLLDYNPVEVPNDFQTSAFTPGQTWSDPNSLLTLTANVADSTGMAFTVSYDTPCATLQSSSTVYPASGSQGTIQVTAPSSCAWTATTATPWITINSGASGSGNGTVSFTVAANQQAPQQTGYITVQRQSVPITQSGTTQVLVMPGSTTPVQGTNGHFIFTVSDASGPSDISGIVFNFNDLANSGCYVLTYGQQYLGGFYILNDNGTQFITFSGGSVSNSQCTLYSDSTETISGNTITVNLHIQFPSSVAGSHVGNATATTNENVNYGPFGVGSWLIPYTGPYASMNNQFLSFGTIQVGSTSAVQTAALTNTGQNTLSIGLISFTGANPSQFTQTNNCGSSLAAGASCTFSITFSPTESGALSATMNIADSANGSPHLVFLRGSGQYSLGVSPSSLTFENQIVNTASPAQNVTLTNLGSAPLSFSSISITGTNAGSFSDTSNCPAQLAAGSSCTVAVTFTPPSAATADASLSLSYVPSGTIPFTISVPLTGTGVSSVSAPIFEPVAGTYAGAQSTTLSDQTAEAAIYYTTDGSTPGTSSNKYSGAIPISSSTTLKAIAIVSGVTPSPVTTAAYTLVFPVAAQTTLTASPTTSTQGTVFTLQAAVIANGTHVSSGSVTFYDGTVVLGTTQVVSSTGIATLKTASLMPGTNAIQAKFNHDNLDANDSSNIVNVSVTGSFATTATLSSSGTQGSYSLTANFSSFGAGTPAGTVTFNDTSTQSALGTATPKNIATIFTGTGTLTEPSTTEDIALGDVNGDGHLDLVTASYNGGTNWVTVALGNGDGTFQAAKPVTTLAGDNNGGPAVALADVNGDGKLDIIAASWAGYGVAVFLGNGDGTFGPEVDYALDGGYANSIATGDFNGDGKVDIVTSDPFGNSISVLLGNGDGTFQSEHAFATDSSPVSVTVADLNNDGRLDIAVSNSTGTVSVFLGNGDGTFQVLPLISVSSSGQDEGPRAIAAGDLNGDGNVDLAVSIWDSSSIAILPGNGDGTFQPAKLIYTPNMSPTGVVIADINRDGKLDMVESSYNFNLATVLINTGGDTFNVATYPVDDGSGSVAVGDLNGDGLIDFATVSSVTATASVRLAQTTFSAELSQVTLPGVGSDNITASYGADPVFGSATSNALSLASNASAAATPTFTPAAGTYATAQSVSITDSTPGAVIYYTTNGTTPTTASTKFTTSINVVTTETIKAIAVATGYANSPVGSSTYTINSSQVPVTLTPSSLSFPVTNVGSSSVAQVVTVKNTGTSTLFLNSEIIGGTNASSFLKSTTSCGTSLAVGSSCNVSVQFKPTAEGSLSASLSISDSATGSPQSVALSGTGGAPVASFTPTSIVFPVTAVGATSAAKAVTIENTGNTTLFLNSEYVTGTSASSYLKTSTTCGASLAVGASCTVSLEFEPTAEGPLIAYLAMGDNAAGSPQMVKLSGTGSAPLTTFSPTSLTFATTTVGATSAAQTVTLSNTGNATLFLTSETITGTGASSYVKTGSTCGSYVTAGNSCTVSIAFNPAAEGVQIGYLSVADNAAGSPQTVKLSGTGSAPVVSLSPTSLSFANATVGTTSSAQTVTVKNAGNATLTFSSVSVTGANASSFIKSASTCGSSLTAGSSCTISIEFQPTATGPLSAALSLVDNAAGSPQSVPLSGTGQ